MGERRVLAEAQWEAMSRLALGTVQFGFAYGVANTSGQVSLQAIGTILQHAQAAGVDTLDTAIAYGDSETRLGAAGVDSWRIVTKLPALPADVADVPGWIRTQVLGSLQRLRVTRLDGLLLHRSADLTGPHASSYIQALANVKACGWVRSTGISIYDPAELATLWPTWRPDLIQAPYNVFDRRLEHSGWLGKLHAAGVRVHVRSAFLQGLLLMPAARRPAYFERWRPLLDRWLEWCGRQGSTPLASALAFVLSQPGVERLVAGVDSPAQLEEILSALAVRAALVAPADLYSDELELIEPSRWQLT
jgi:aryl-alcohol dehydrogenase-like predicted oxidoreductase